jgi:hypothetical protein
MNASQLPSLQVIGSTYHSQHSNSLECLAGKNERRMP